MQAHASAWEAQVLLTRLPLDQHNCYQWSETSCITAPTWWVTALCQGMSAGTPIVLKDISWHQQVGSWCTTGYVGSWMFRTSNGGICCPGGSEAPPGPSTGAWGSWICREMWLILKSNE